MLFAVAALTGCTPGRVDVDVPAPQGQAAAACRALDAALPDVVDGQDTRPTAPVSPYAAAWGEPAIVLRCGVGRPADLKPTSQLFTVNDVDWLPIENDDAWTFTTTGRVAYVEVVVPKAYDPAVNPLVDLAGPITQTVPTAAGAGRLNGGPSAAATRSGSAGPRARDSPPRSPAT
jgi:hypothetical protein